MSTNTGAGNDINIKTTAARAPVTFQRPVPTDLERYIDHPSAPRASEAVSKEKPKGTEDYDAIKEERTVLQQHVSFFDHDHDGIITPWDTLVGFSELGFNIIFSLAAAVIIHLSFFWITQDYWFPNPLLWIYVKNIHKGKHGSDSGTYDHEGRFVPENFEQIFSKFAKRDSSGTTMTSGELFDFIKAQRNVVDPFGWFAMYFEWLTAYLLIGRNGKMNKEDVRGMFDGSLFYNIRKARQRQGQSTKHNIVETGKRMGEEIKRRVEEAGEELRQTVAPHEKEKSG